MSKLIEGTRTARGTIVEVVEDGSRRALRHIVEHSPTGLEWGYAGSGPADLARSILVEVMGDRAICRACEGVGRLYWHAEEGDFEPRSKFSAEELNDLETAAAAGEDYVVACFECRGNALRRLPYMRFKAEVVAKLPRAGFVLPAAAVEKWLEDLDAAEPDRIPYAKLAAVLRDESIADADLPAELGRVLGGYEPDED